MKKQYVYFYITLIVILVLITFKHTQEIEPDILNNQEIEQLNFTNTSNWKESLLVEMKKYKEYASENNIVNDFVIKDFPKNSSTETRDELNYLLSLKDKRTIEKINEINMERYFDGMYFNNIPLTDYFDPSKYEFAEDFHKAFSEVSSIVLFEKENFNRVRPHLLEAEIEPVIEVPGHPAYPSGHATQAYFTAYYLSEKYPENTDVYFEDAKRIATNREIAGVHYPSDSEAGRTLAEQYFKSLPQRNLSNFDLLLR